MSKSSVLETDSDGHLSAAKVSIICRVATIFSFAERGVDGAGCCAEFTWNCSKRAFTCGSSSFDNEQLTFFWDEFSICDLIESSSANDLNWPGPVGRSQSWAEAGLATKAASRSAIFFRKYSTRFMRRCPFYWSLLSPVPNSIIKFSRKHQILNVNSRTTRPAFLRAARVPTSPQSHPSKWRQRHRLRGVGCWQQSLREILRGSKSSSAWRGRVDLYLDSGLAVEGRSYAARSDSGNSSAE